MASASEILKAYLHCARTPAEDAVERIRTQLKKQYGTDVELTVSVEPELILLEADAFVRPSVPPSTEVIEKSTELPLLSAAVTYVPSKLNVYPATPLRASLIDAAFLSFAACSLE